MFLKKLTLNSFGKLSGTCCFSANKANLICQPNESGKTTLADAILYSFYNFPPSGSHRGGLKPKDRYKPWLDDSRGKFQTEMEVIDVNGRSYRLLSNFGKQQPFEVTDLTTMRQVALEGMSFGRRFFKMPIHTFTDCFFLRQDHNESSRDDLIQLIEEAAASNQHRQDSPVRSALVALSECRVHMPEFAAGPITLDNLIRGIEKKLAVGRARVAELNAERAARQQQIAAAEKLDEQIEALQLLQNRLEYELALAEAGEIAHMLEQHERLVSVHRERRERLDALSGYEKYDTGLLPRVQALSAELKTLSHQHAHATQNATHDILEPLRRIEQEIAGFPQQAASAARENLDRLKLLRSAFTQQKQEIESQQAECESLREQLEAQGVDLFEADQLQHTLKAVSASDARILLEHDTERAKIEAAIAEADHRCSEASTRVAEAKSLRDKLRMITTLWFLAMVFTVLLCVCFMIVRMMWPAAIWLAGASAVSAVVLLIMGVRSLRIAKAHEVGDLEPGIAEEISCSGDVRRQKEALDVLDMEFHELLRRRELKIEDLQKARKAAAYGQLMLPYQSAQEHLARLRERFAATCSEATERVRPLIREATAVAVDARMIDTCISQTASYLEHCAERERLSHTGERALGDADAIQAHVQELISELERLIGDVEGDPQRPLQERVEAFIAGCQHALKLHALSEGGDSPEVISPVRADELRERAHVLAARMQELEQMNPALGAIDNPTAHRSALEQQLQQAKHQREELRGERINTFKECDRSIENWRREGPQITADIERLELLRQETADFREALQIAGGELTAISDQVFSQWAAAINSRVSGIMGSISPGYTEVEFSDDLEPTVYSMELQRRLAAREIQHLSKGARDQLGFAARVAVSEYLSAHVGNLPLLLDEPFAHWDDDRFAAGMRFLADLTARHQIIMLTCQHWRCRELERRDPELAARFNFCEVEPLDSPAVV